MCRDEIEGNFVPNADPESLAKAQIAKHETKQLDATGWLAADLHFADIPWLKKGDHDASLVLPGDEYEERYSLGKEGFLSIFVLNN